MPTPFARAVIDAERAPRRFETSTLHVADALILAVIGRLRNVERPALHDRIDRFANGGTKRLVKGRMRVEVVAGISFPAVGVLRDLDVDPSLFGAHRTEPRREVHLLLVAREDAPSHGFVLDGF